MSNKIMLKYIHSHYQTEGCEDMKNRKTYRAVKRYFKRKALRKFLRDLKRTENGY